MLTITPTIHEVGMRSIKPVTVLIISSSEVWNI